MNAVINWTEQGLIPDTVIRAGVRHLCKQRLAEIYAGNAEASSGASEQFVAHMNAAKLALLPHKANEQHYEVPAAFYAAALGEHRKYIVLLASGRVESRRCRGRGPRRHLRARWD